MKLDEKTLIEIEDYIQALDENVGLKIATIKDISQALNKHRGLRKKLIIPVVSNKKSARTSLPLTNQALWDMAKTITDKQKEAFNLTKPVDWTSLEEDWFDWLEEGIFGEEP
jgi:hypothetical protein